MFCVRDHAVTWIFKDITSNCTDGGQTGQDVNHICIWDDKKNFKLSHPSGTDDEDQNIGQGLSMKAQLDRWRELEAFHVSLERLLQFEKALFYCICVWGKKHESVNTIITSAII